MARRLRCLRTPPTAAMDEISSLPSLLMEGQIFLQNYKDTASPLACTTPKGNTGNTTKSHRDPELNINKHTGIIRNRRNLLRASTKLFTRVDRLL